MSLMTRADGSGDLNFSEWLPGLGSNLGAVFITNDLTEVIGCFNADSLTNSMHSSGVHIGLE